MSSPQKDLAQRKLQWWIQIFLIQCNLILSIVGIGGLTVSVVTKSGFFGDLILLDYYENFHFNVFLSCSAVLIVIGWLGILGALSGKKIIIANALLLFVFEVGTTIYIIIMNVFSDYTNTGKLYKYMQEQMESYSYLNNHIIDALQTTLLCCGLDDITTWNTRKEIPISCCRNNQTETECKLGSPYLQTNGCFGEFVHMARYYAWLLFLILVFSGLLMNFGIALAYLQDRIINDKKKEKSARKDSLKISRPTCSLHTISQEIEEGKDEVDNEKKKDTENTNKENNSTAKSEENHSSEKDNVKEADPNTCRNIRKNVVTLYFH